MYSTLRSGLRLLTLPGLVAAAAVSARAASIGDKVFVDGNKNGLFNAGEPGLPAIGLTLTWAGPDGDLATTGDNSTFNQTTDANGNFNFTGLQAGNFRLDLDNTTLPVGLAPAAGSDPRIFSGVGAADAVTTADFAVVSSGLNLTLWTVNEADPGTSLARSGSGSPRIFCFTNYADSSGQSQFIDYGQLVWRDDNGVIQTFAGGDETNAECLAIDTRNGDVYVIVNPATGGFTVPVLFKTSLFALRPNAAQIELTRVGEIRDAGGNAATTIEGIAFDEPNNLIYAVNTEGNQTADPERLLEINPQTAVWAIRGLIQGTVSGTSYALTYTDGLEVVPQFNPAGQVTGGTFYGYDQQDRHLYRINPADGAITALVNTEANTSTDIETIAWDEQLGRMIAVDNGLDRLSSLPIDGAATAVFSTYAQQGLSTSQNVNDLEGAGFFLRGAFPLAQIGNHIWNDSDGNGRWDTGEASIVNVAVDLYFDGNNDGDFDDAGETAPYASTVTGAQGFYQFDGLQAGRYQVRLPVSNFGSGQPLENWNVSSPVTDTSDNREDADDNGSQPAPGAVVTGPAIVLTEGEIDRTVDFGMMSADFGDAPEEYPVLLVSGGAWHAAAGPFLGAARDAETEGQPTGDASGDGSDEDGVTLPAYLQATASISFTVESSTAGARLDAWIDWNRDGDWNDAGEQILTGHSTAAGQNVIPLTVPPDLTPGASFARFRLSSAGALPPGGGAADGEVEDYMVTLYQVSAISGFITANNGDGGGGEFAFAGGTPVEGAVLVLYTDPDFDGYPDDGVPVDDPSLPGVQPYTVLSLSDGSYLFGNLLAGNYVVRMTPPPGFRVFDDADESEDDAGSPPDAPNPNEDHLIAASPAAGEEDTQNNFTIDPVYAFTGNRLWLDENSNGLQDAGERGIPNVQIAIYDATGALVTTALTDTDGGWLVRLEQGNYFVDVDEASLPPGLTQSPFTLPGADFGNQDQSSSGPGDYGYPVTLTPGAENLTADFGYNYNPPGDVTGGTGTGAIGDRVWIDVDADGFQDPDEAGLGGVTLTLFTPGDDGIPNTPDDAAAGTTISNAAGYYIFDGLPPGVYSIAVTGGVGPEYDQTGDPDHYGVTPGVNDGRTTTPILLSPGDVYLNADFGYQPDEGNCVGDYVWLDRDGNGSQGATEEGIPGVTVALIRDTNCDGVWDAGEPIIATDVTDAGGIYHFRGIPDSAYIIWVNDTDNVLDALYPSFDPDGTGTPRFSAIDLDCAGTNPIGILDYSVDFGFTPPGHSDGRGSIGDFVWLDANRDGVQDPGESGLEGVLVGLYDSTGSTLLATTRTDENGAYWFGDLDPAAAFTIVIDPANFAPGALLAGMEATWDADGSGSTPHESVLDLAAPGSDGNNDTDGLNNNINPGQDFGYAAPVFDSGFIGDLVWLDQNADGISQGSNGPDGVPGTDDDEPGLPGITLALYRDLDRDGVLDPGEPLTGTTVTDSAGAYLFTGLSTDDGTDGADYLVQVTDYAGLLGGYWHSTGTPGVNGHSQRTPYPVALTAGAPGNVTADFGFYIESAAVGNRVFMDNDWSRTQNTGDTGLSGVRVTLTIIWPGGSISEIHTLSGAGGFYSFGNLLLDENHRRSDGPSSDPNAPPVADDPSQPQYIIGLDGSQPALDGLMPTLSNRGINDRIDSDTPAGVVAAAVKGLTAVAAGSDPALEPAIASYDFGYTSLKPLTWIGFLNANNLTGPAATPAGNPDGDIYPNILEYAFCLPPRTGTPRTPNGDPAFCLLQGALGTYHAVITRPIGLAGATYTLEYAGALADPTTWSAVTTIIPTVTDNGNGTESLRWLDLESIPALAAGQGFLRVAVTLDTNGDTAPDAAAATYVMGWYDHAIATQCETWSNPFLSKEPFSGTADGECPQDTLLVSASASGTNIATLLAGESGLYAEILSGPYEGHRFMVDIPACGFNSIALAPGHPFNTASPIPDLSSAPFVLRSAFTVGSQFPATAFQSAGDAATADNLLIFNPATQTWRTLFLGDLGGFGTYWVDTADAGGPPASQNQLLLNPGHGLFVHRRGAPLTTSMFGVVRENDYRSPLGTGHTLVGGGYPLDQSYASRNMSLTQTGGFTGSTDIRTSDQVLFWAGDATPGHVCYRSHYLLDAGAPYRRWVDADDNFAALQDNTAHFKATRAAFHCRPAAPLPGWVMPAPWTSGPVIVP